MTDLLLTHGYFLAEDEKEQAVMKPYPPLGLLYLSAYLKRQDVDVEVFDSTFADRAELDRRLAAGTPSVLGVYTNLMTRPSVLDLIARAKRHGWMVVLGGPESGNYPRQYLDHGADVIVIGEGEATLEALLPALAERGPQDLHGVLGTVFRDRDGELIDNGPRPQIDDIDSLPWPDREAIDMQRYVDCWRQHHGMGSVNLITARGCPYKCRWCSHAVYGYTHRRRDAIDCAAEVEHIRDRYQPDMVWYADDVFTIHHRWLYTFRAELEQRGVHLPFETISRADRMMDDNVLECLAAMGCYRIWIGSESGSQRILDRMQRQVTVEQVHWATKAAQRHGIEVGMFLMWGYEGETENDIAATVEHVKHANPDIFFTTVSYPIKNTRYFDEVADRVTLSKPWAVASDRDFVVAGRPRGDYYRHADTWLRAAVDAHRLRDQDPRAAAEKNRIAGKARAALRASWRLQSAAGELAAGELAADEAGP